VQVAGNPILDTIVQRRSIRRYSSEPVDPELIETLLHAAIWAPSAHNRQPWRFAVIRSALTKHHLAWSMGQRLRTDLEADQTPEHVIAADVQRSYERITSAPVLILICLSMEHMDSYSDVVRNTNERVMAIQSTAMAGQNLLLGAHELGLGACWMCAPLFCPDVVRDALTLPQDWEAQGLITLGYPAQERKKTRNPLDLHTIWL